MQDHPGAPGTARQGPTRIIMLVRGVGWQIATGGGPGRRGGAGGHGQRPPGAGLCPGHRATGQDRRAWTRRCWRVCRHRSARTVRPLRDAETQALNALATRRHQVLTMLVAEKNRRGHRHRLPFAAHRGHRVMADPSPRQTLRQSPVRRAACCAPSECRPTLRAPGWPADVPLATMVRPSTGIAAPWGQTHRLGRAAPGSAVLYMGALVASRCNPVIRAFYQRLLAAASRGNLAPHPCMRKLHPQHDAQDLPVARPDADDTASSFPRLSTESPGMCPPLGSGRCKWGTQPPGRDAHEVCVYQRATAEGTGS